MSEAALRHQSSGEGSRNVEDAASAAHVLCIVRDAADAVEYQLLRAYERQAVGPIPMLNDALRQFRAFQAFWAEMAGDASEASLARHQARILTTPSAMPPTRE